MTNDVCATTTCVGSPTPIAKNRLFGMQIPTELDTQIGDAARRHNLTKSAVARMAIERGLPVLAEQLETGGLVP
jgi:hypothetical protein